MEAGIPYVYIVEVKAGERAGGQVFAEQAKGPESSPQHLCQKLSQGHVLCWGSRFPELCRLARLA